jgi:hypothetical protein
MRRVFGKGDRAPPLDPITQRIVGTVSTYAQNVSSFDSQEQTFLSLHATIQAALSIRSRENYYAPRIDSVVVVGGGTFIGTVPETIMQSFGRTTNLNRLIVAQTIAGLVGKFHVLCGEPRF